jgi:Replication protein
VRSHDVDTDTLADPSDGDQTLADASWCDSGEDWQAERDNAAIARALELESGSSPEGASPRLGPQHALSHKVARPPLYAPTAAEVLLAETLATARAARRVEAAELRAAAIATACAREQTRLSNAEIVNAAWGSKWDRAETMAELLAYSEWNRQAKCHRTRRIALDDTRAERFDTGAYKLFGLVLCGHMTCPHCGTARAKEAALVLGVAMDRFLDEHPDHDVWMLTLSPPNYLDDNPRDLIGRLYDVKELLWRSSAYRAFAKRWGVRSRVVVLDVTFGGPNGLHPHFHCALFVERARIRRSFVVEVPEPPRLVVTDENGRPLKRPREPMRKVEQSPEQRRKAWELYRKRVVVYDERRRAGAAEHAKAIAAYRERVVELALDADEKTIALRNLDADERVKALARIRAELLPAFGELCVDVGFDIRKWDAFEEHALDLTPSESAARYFTKWGLADEVAATTSKSLSHLRLLDLVAAGSDRAGDTYIQFRAAVDGKAWIIGIGDLRHRFEISDEDLLAKRDELRELREQDLRERGEPLPEPKTPLSLKIRAHLYPTALELGWPVVFGEIDRLADVEHLAGDELQAAFDRWLTDQRLARPRPPPRAGPPAPAPNR